MWKPRTMCKRESEGGYTKESRCKNEHRCNRRTYERTEKTEEGCHMNMHPIGNINGLLLLFMLKEKKYEIE
jgi:hypothetical protein